MHHEIVSLARPDSHQFTMSSEAGIFVDRMCEVIGKGDKNRGREFFISRGKFMTEAEAYIGLCFHWKRETFTRVDGQEVKLLMPVAYLGEKEVSGER